MAFYLKTTGKTVLNRWKKQKSNCYSIHLMPNYRYFSSFLSHLNPAVSGEIFGWKHQLPRSKMFYPTLGCRDNYVAVWLWIYVFKNPILFHNYLSPQMSHKNDFVFKICVWISVFRRKKSFVIPFNGFWEIQQNVTW